MLSSPKNKKELIEALRTESDFKVLHTSSGPKDSVIQSLRRLAQREITVIVLAK